MNIAFPETPEFYHLRKLLKANNNDMKNRGYEETLIESGKNGLFLNPSYILWVRVNEKYLRYIYFEKLMESDMVDFLPFISFCGISYIIFKHNMQMEKFENIGEEIEELIK